MEKIIFFFFKFKLHNKMENPRWYYSFYVDCTEKERSKYNYQFLQHPQGQFLELPNFIFIFKLLLSLLPHVFHYFLNVIIWSPVNIIKYCDFIRQFKFYFSTPCLLLFVVITQAWFLLN